MPTLPPSSKKFFDMGVLAARYLAAQLASDHRACIRLIDDALDQGATRPRWSR